MIIIPAKGTSRRAPGKNLRWLRNILLILQDDDVVVSTDDPEIGWITGGCGGGFAPRDSNMLGPDATVEDVCREFMLHNAGYRTFCVMLPTAALVRMGDIDRARLLLKGRIDTVIAVARHERDGVTAMAEHRQQTALADCGAFIWCKTAPFRQRRSFYDSPNIAVYVLPFRRGQDVDTPEDIRRVNALLR